MGAYSLVDHNVRKKLDDMLKTWKNPVPGSIDSRPVFPADITRSIDKALLQAKTAALQQQQQQRNNQSAMLRPKSVAAAAGNPWRNTPTPPQNVSRFPPPPPQGYGQNGISNGGYQVRR
jgi:pre-mRNA cleavage complex 2 protein Pcf11